ncbi:MAG: hypothetical protein ACAI44_27485 [Candidatus Sericytochromatia bacterium]
MIFQELVQAREIFAQGTLCLQEAFESRDPGTVSEAVVLFAEAIELWPELEEPYLALAFVASTLGLSKEVGQLVTKVLELNPTNERARRLLSDMSADVPADAPADVPADSQPRRGLTRVQKRVQTEAPVRAVSDFSAAAVHFPGSGPA